MKHRLFLIIATAVVLGSTLSCSQGDELVATDGDQKLPISFNVNIGSLPSPGVTTRGYTTGAAYNSGYTFDGDEYMAVALTHPSGSEVIKQYLVGSGSSENNSLTYKKEKDGTTTGNTFDWLSTSETGVSIRAWSDGVSTSASTPAVDPDGQAFSVETTQSGDVKELLYSPATTHNYTTSAIDIPLYHQLARIVVTITRADATDAISSVAIGHNSDGNRVPITGTFTKPGAGDTYGSWAVASEASQSSHWSVITPKAETAGSVYSAVVVPGNASVYTAGLRLINITIGTKTFAYKIPTGGLTFEAGRQYNFSITVENQGIIVTSTITDWGAGTYDAGDELAVLKDVKMNPLWYVAEGYMTSATTMASTADASYFYTWSAAMTNFAAQTTTYTDYKLAGKTIDGVDGTWHLPVRAEFWSILPGNDRSNSILGFDSETNDQLYSLDGVIFGYDSETKAGVTDISYWRNISTTKCRAIRFLGQEYCSAWEYEVSANTLTITSSLIDVVGNDKALAKAAYDEIDWDNLASEATSIQRTFYLRGYKDNGSSSSADSYVGACMVAWSATFSKYEAGWAGNGSYILYYYNGNLDIDSGGRQSAGFSVRLFRDN